MRTSPTRLWIAALTVAMAVAALGESTLAAQGAVAELRGRVVDESGAALPGATVTVTHRETGDRAHDGEFGNRCVRHARAAGRRL